MSIPLINRSLTTIRTELEFLYDSEVITEDLYHKFLGALPTKYTKDSSPSGVEKLETNGSTSAAPKISEPEKLASDLNKVHIGPPPTPPPAHESGSAKPVGYCRALFDYSAAEADDIDLKKDEKIAVVEHLSEDWWKGYTQSSGPSKTGFFPSNYVSVISEQEFNNAVRLPAQAPQQNKSEKQNYSPQSQHSVPAPPQYDQYNQQNSYNQGAPPPMVQQPSYNQFPPPSTNYYQQQGPPPQQFAPQQQPPPQQQQQQQPQGSGHPHLKKFGSKLGNAAIFGAGATIGSDIVNSIF